jgi:hypothetical protein
MINTVKICAVWYWKTKFILPQALPVKTLPGGWT